MPEKKKNFLIPFKQFGIIFNDHNEKGDYFADCPFSEKQNKLSVNKNTGLWQSWTTGKKGNLISFIREMYTLLKENTEAIDLKPLTDNKGLPTWLLIESIAYNPINNSYLIPYKNAEGQIANVAHYNIGEGKAIKTGTLNQMLLGVDELTISDANTVFIAEGEWDYYAMKWLVRRNNLQHVIIGLPGANIFKEEWVDFFRDKEVFCLLDNDAPGRTGTDRLQEMLTLHVYAIKYINWPVDLKDGYDIRDYILDYCGNISGFRTKHVSCYNDLIKLMHSDTPNELAGLNKKPIISEEKVEIPSIEEVEKLFKHWFKLEDDDISLDIILGSCFANKIPGEPVWLYIVGPPGSRKTAMVSTLSKSRLIETVSTVNATGLISGMRAIGSEDPSLIPKLNGRILVIKDVTTMLSKNAVERDEVFGILRDAYDGYCEKPFGTGIKKSFKSTFGILGAVTPIIDGYSSVQSIVGERFLKFRIETILSMYNEFAAISKTLENITHEEKMNNELQDMMYRLLEKKVPDDLIPFETTHIRETFIYLGMFVAKVRGSLNINPYTQEQLSLPSKEIGTRVSKELTKLAMGVCVLRDHKAIGEYELNRCKRIAMDTCPDRNEMIVRYLYVKKEPVLTQDIINHSMLTPATVSRVMTSLIALKMLKRVETKKGMPCRYALTKNMVDLIEKSKVYQDEKSVQAKSMIRIKKKLHQRKPVKIKKKSK